MGNTPVDHPVYIQAVEYMKEFIAVFEFEPIHSGSELFSSTAITAELWELLSV